MKAKSILLAIGSSEVVAMSPLLGKFVLIAALGINLPLAIPTADGKTVETK